MSRFLPATPVSKHIGKPNNLDYLHLQWGSSSGKSTEKENEVPFSRQPQNSLFQILCLSRVYVAEHRLLYSRHLPVYNSFPVQLGHRQFNLGLCGKILSFFQIGFSISLIWNLIIAITKESSIRSFFILIFLGIFYNPFYCFKVLKNRWIRKPGCPPPPPADR